ncbi:carboxypeptidase-like regulatory domain-containing protein [Pedobacter sp. MC2016-24]|uniref:carboxypeptidase-like regulatory domain-containing protein n=1 Tax=Pedobacter sp. MC2016-24 TaxID=2780090 RepID=UPI00187E0A77|nr:carboxypeptidase-like regulatory domain-containing protein [Pedobacter sp. MC2016-24]MBE9602044.1 carboxypeptidase-like regulatory domain-containing protein [Pedobacter sp. MC2016-24]
MKLFLRSFLLFLCSFNAVFAQKKLSSSREAAYYTYIYQIKDHEAFAIASKSSAIVQESFLHSRIDSFYTDSAKPLNRKLPFGNYLYVTAVQNKLTYTLKPVQNVNLEFINNRKEFQFMVTDLKGNRIDDAEVKIGKGKTVKFDAKAGLYKSNYGQKIKVIAVKYAGVSNYFTYEVGNNNNVYARRQNSFFKKFIYSAPVKYIWMPFRRWFNPDRYGNRKIKNSTLPGYMVFNKPMYKPLDTVKFKAYLVDKNGTSLYNKTLRVSLDNYGQKKRILTNLDPYREGGYTYSFVLADSLKLQLDQHYTISLEQPKGDYWETVYTGSFRYEDYELKSVSFKVRSDQKSYGPGSPVTVFMKATDENELVVPDGRVEVILRADDVFKYHQGRVFVKDSLWKTTVTMDPVGETKLVIPDSVFPKADLNFTAYFTFLNSNNERKTASERLKYNYENKRIKYEFKNDSLYLDYLVDEKPVPQPAVLQRKYPNKEAFDTLGIQLPTAIKLNYNAEAYVIKTASGYRQEIEITSLQPGISIAAAQGKDSVRIVVNNAHRVPFWFTVFSGNSILSKGYTRNLDTLFKHGTAKAVHVRINYLWAGKEMSLENSTYYMPNLLNVKLIGPDVVYPGQQVNLLVNVTDAENKPVPKTDVTAYAYTAKFKNGYAPGLPNFGKGHYARKLKPMANAQVLQWTGDLQLNWDKWAKSMNLDTIEYYKFTQTKSVYTLQEDGNDRLKAVVAPFVIKDGAIEPVHILYIDGLPVYFSQANQLQRYAFEVSPGSHSIQLRTANHSVFLDDYSFPQGKKTIISVLADVKNTVARVIKEKSELSEQEANALSQYMIRIADNFHGDKSLLAMEGDTLLLNPPLTERMSSLQSLYRNPQGDQNALLVGPVRQNLLSFSSGILNMNFLKEPGYTYTFLPGLLKQKSYAGKYGFNRQLASGSNPGVDYKAYPVSRGEIDRIWNEYLDLRSSTTTLFSNSRSYDKQYGRLVMNLDTTILKQLPYLKNILIYRYDQPDFLEIYPGNTNQFNPLEKGKYRVIYLFKDNRYVVAEQLEIRSAGVNYVKWEGLKIHPADQLSRKIDFQIKSVNIGSNPYGQYTARDNIVEDINAVYFDPATLKGVMRGRVLAESDKKPILGAVVIIKGTKNTVTTDAQGYFTIKIPERGMLVISYIGYERKEVPLTNADAGDIIIAESYESLNEVVVVGYGTQRKQLLTGSVSEMSIGNALAGRVAGVAISNADKKIMIRGMAPVGGQKPLIIVDGVPFSGDMEALDPATLSSIDVLKDAAATAIYGSSAAAGVIIIKTKGGNAMANAAGELVQQKGSMRTNFSDYAIWQPKLLTDAAGNATFTVRFPDDITNWNTRVVAMNGRKQSGQAESNIKSFKMLSANFVSPQFALAGDSIRVIGKLMNYGPSEEEVIRKFSYNGAELLNTAVKFKNAKIDTISIVAKGAGMKVSPEHVGVLDSLSFTYTMTQKSGYFDGELRKIPLFQKGVLETKGYFDVLSRDTAAVYQFDAKLGKVTLNAEASVFPTLLDEIEKVNRYEYLCNEQTASKLKALLLEKKIRKYLGEEFKEEKNIQKLLKKLVDSRTPQGTWGWWQNSNEELWISLHVVESLLEAQKQGYTVSFDKDRLYNYLVDKMASNPGFNQVYGIKMLHLLDDKYYLKDWVLALEKQRTDLEASYALERKKHPDMPELAKQPLYERLQLVQLKQLAGISVDLKWMLDLKKETMFGNIYWGAESNRFWDNSIQNSLLAYQILKRNGGYPKQLDHIQRYFLEQRRDGQWRNTYESSLILETILPDLIVEGKKPEPASLVLNQTETITKFPFHKVMEAGEVQVKQKGNAPVYFTAYQQFHNPNPEKVSKDFTVKTSFVQQGDVVKKLKAGTLVVLRTEVEVRADADYVMIEIPVPAGCSYENKMQSFWGVETHREYFKQKTSIFCTKLKKGKYTFDVELMPRYSGSYVLNPAKAEMMYFPVFYGREGMKRVQVN